MKRYEILLPEMLGEAGSHIYDLYYALVQAALFSDIGITLKELGARTGVSPNTLRKLLKGIPHELLRIDKTYREYHYCIDTTQLDKLLDPFTSP